MCVAEDKIPSHEMKTKGKSVQHGIWERPPA